MATFILVRHLPLISWYAVFARCPVAKSELTAAAFGESGAGQSSADDMFATVVMDDVKGERRGAVSSAQRGRE